MDFRSLQQIPGSGNGNDSGNWPVLLVKRKQTLLVVPELDAAWFGRTQSEQLVESGERAPFQIVSRRRLRLAHALFVLAFGAVLALLTWEIRIHVLDRSDSGDSVIR